MTERTRDATGLPVVDPSTIERQGEDDGDATRAVTVAGVLLAAGVSSRFGEPNKLLARLDGEPLVRRAARTVLEASVDPVVVVVGYEADRVRAALDGLDVTFVENDDYEQGQATSVSAGVRAVRDQNVDAALFALGDMPSVRPETVNALVDAYRAGVGDALAAAYDGQRGNPVLFDAHYFDRLADVSGDTGGRQILLTSEDAVLVETGDPGVLTDIDTRSDLERV